MIRQRDPDAVEDHITIEGFYHRPLEELPQELRDSLTWDGSGKLRSQEDFRAEIEGKKGREWLYSVTITDDSYATK